MIGLKMRALEAIYAITFVIGSMASYPEQCFNEFCFKTPGSDVKRDFEGAKSWCAEESSQLAVVSDHKTQQMLIQFLSSSQLNEPAFVNIRLYEHQLLNTWFLVSGPNYFGGISNQGDKTRDYALYSCLNYSSDGFVMMASNPNQFRNYVCEFRDTSMCSYNSTNNYIYNGSCFIKYDNEALTWFLARERCHNIGGDLATFSYVNDSYTYIYNPLFNTSWLDAALSYWVGIRWDKWLWKSPECGDELIYTAWSDGEPNNTDFGCVCVDPNGNPSLSWIDCDCDAPRQFVCLKIVPSTLSPNPEPRGISQAMLIGLVLGIGVNLPLLIIILVLVIIIIHQKRRFREKTKSGESASQTARTTPRETSTMELETDAGDERYAHLRQDTALGQRNTPKSVYEKIKRPS